MVFQPLKTKGCGMSEHDQQMKFGLRPTGKMPFPNEYVKALDGEYSDYAYNEKRALDFKGQWLSQAFVVPEEVPLDLEIGTGNGYHFAHHAEKHPERCLVGVELKYKPLIQSIRRAVLAGSKNARMMRYHARFISEVFEDNEVNNIYIHHPDPWLKKRQKKNRLLQLSFLNELYQIQKTNHFVEIKMDSRDYFDQTVENAKASEFEIEFLTYDLHNSEQAQYNFITQFENFFLRDQQPIYYLRLRNTKPPVSRVTSNLCRQ